MKKILKVLIMVFIVLSLFSYVFVRKIEKRVFNMQAGGSIMSLLNENNDDRQVDVCMEKIVEAINNHDKDEIKDLFSEQALSEAVYLDEGIDYLFTLINGEIESWDKTGGSGKEEKAYGNITSSANYQFNVKTKEENYKFSILLNTRDDMNPQNVGLYRIKAHVKKDLYKLTKELQNFQGAGIFIPEEKKSVQGD